MGDRSCFHNLQHDAFSQYHQHHAQMSKWMQQLHSNFPPFPPHHCHLGSQLPLNPCQSFPLSVQNSCNSFPMPPLPIENSCHAFPMPPLNSQHCCSHRNVFHPPPIPPLAPHHCIGRSQQCTDNSYSYPVRMQEHSNVESYENQYSYDDENLDAYGDDTEVYYEEEYEDEEEEETGFVLNVEAILAMRTAKDAMKAKEKAETQSSKKKSKAEKKGHVSDGSDFELIEPDYNELYLELDDFGKVQRKHGRKTRPHTAREMREEQAVRQHLYGDQANKIAGLETSMQITFDHLCDTLQPHLWPVLPVRL